MKNYVWILSMVFGLNWQGAWASGHSHEPAAPSKGDHSEHAPAPKAHVEAASAHSKQPETHSVAATSGHHSEHSTTVPHANEASAKGWFGKAWAKVTSQIDSIQEKIEGIRRLEFENVDLKKENLALRVQLETEAFTGKKELERVRSEAESKKNLVQTGNIEGRRLESIPRDVPRNLGHEELFTLGVHYFKNQHDEKAVAILYDLLEGRHSKKYDSAETHLMLGVSFYRLKNDILSKEHIEKSKKLAQSVSGSIALQNQADLWLALLNKRQNKAEQSQKYIVRVLERDPHRIEAKWVNPQEGNHEGGKKPASQDAHH